MLIRPGTSLDTFVREWALEMLGRPTEASKPENIRALVEAADKTWDGGFVAEHAPVAPLSWEANAICTSDGNESERADFNFPYAMEVVGAYVSICPILPVPQGLVVPTKDDVMVMVDINEAEELTALDGQNTVSSTKRGGNFVTLGSIHVQAPRLFGLKLIAPKPNIGAAFKYKQANVYCDCLIGITWYTKDMGHRLSANVPAQYER